MPTYKRKGDQRVYDKIDWCTYCEQPFRSSINKHLAAMHSTEGEVLAVLALPIGSKERKKKWTRLQNMGSYKHNSKVCIGFGILSKEDYSIIHGTCGHELMRR